MNIYKYSCTDNGKGYTNKRRRMRKLINAYAFVSFAKVLGKKSRSKRAIHESIGRLFSKMKIQSTYLQKMWVSVLNMSTFQWSISYINHPDCDNVIFQNEDSVWVEQELARTKLQLEWIIGANRHSRTWIGIFTLTIRSCYGNNLNGEIISKKDAGRTERENICARTW